MSWKYLWQRIFDRRKAELDLDAEVGSYFDTLVSRYMGQGMTREEAYRAARVRCEGPEQIKEKVRDVRVGAAFEALLKDVRYAARMLRKSPSFVAVAVCSLAIGIGANSAVYSFAEWFLLRPLPVPQPSGVVAVVPVKDAVFGNSKNVSYPDYVALRDGNRSFSGLTATAESTFGFAPDRATASRMKYGMLVSGNFFKVLGVEPAMGRGFREDEDQVAGRDAVVVLGHDLWAAEYRSNPTVIGQKMWLNGFEFTIIGVAPESFTGTDPFIRMALYVPLAMSARFSSDNKLDDRKTQWLNLKGRLNPGVDMTQAEADLDVIASALRKTYPLADANLRLKVESQLKFQSEISPPSTALVVMLSVLAFCVLLVACGNVAGLLLSRSGARSREIAVRLAIGAGRGAVIRQLMVENLLLALTGGIAGLAVAYLGVRFLNTIPTPSSDLPFNRDIHVDAGMLFFTVATSLLSTFLFGLAPALGATRPDLVPALKAIDGGHAKQRRMWGRSLIVSGQVAMSLVLLIVSAVMVEGFRTELAQGPGFRTSHLFVMSFDTSLLHYTSGQRDLFYRQLLERTRAAAGVQSAAMAAPIPMAFGSALGVIPEGYKLKAGRGSVDVFDSVVSDGYFETLGISLVEGRGFLESDRADTPLVAIVNEQFASHYWPNQDAIGKRVRLRGADGPMVEVVGVSRTTKYIFIAEAPIDFVYLPFSQNPQAQMTLLAQSHSPGGNELAPVLRGVVHRIDPNMPGFDARSMVDFYENRAVKSPNLIVELVGALGVMGLVLAVIGLYGLMSYSVSRRTREIGIRMAIGANRSGITGMVLKQGLILGSAGVSVGLLLGFFVSRAMTSIMFLHFGRLTVRPFAAVSVLLILVTMGAAYVPARRAARVDPMRALRDE